MDSKTWRKINILLSENENKCLEDYLNKLMREKLNYIHTTHDTLESLPSINLKVVMLEVSYHINAK